MNRAGFARTGRRVVIALGAGLLAAPHGPRVNAAAPQVTITTNRVQVRAASASLVETIDALGRAGNVKVTYDGPRPAATLYDLEIDATSVGQALFRLLEGQNINYGVVFDLAGQRVTTLMILGVAPRSSLRVGDGVRSVPRPLAPPAPLEPQGELPEVDDEPPEESQEAAEPEPTPSPAGPARLPPPISPFAPRPAFGNPQAPRPEPSPTPLS